VLIDTGQPEKAVGLTLKAMALNPSFADRYRYCLGWAYYSLGRYKDAAAAIQRFLINVPDKFDAQLDLAATLIELGRAEEAQAAVTKALQLWPSCSLEIMRQIWPGRRGERYYAALGKAGLK